MKADWTNALLLLAADFVSMVAAFNVIGYYRGLGAHLIVVPFLAPLCALVIAYYLIDGYRIRTDLLSAEYASLHAIASVSAMLATLFLAYVLVARGYSLQTSRAVIILSFLALIPPTLGFRRLIYRRLPAIRGQGAVVFLGESFSRSLFREDCLRMNLRQPVIYAALQPGGSADPGVPGVRPFLEILAEVDCGQLAVEAIVVRESNQDFAPDLAERLVRLHFDGVPTYTLELFHQVWWRKIPLYGLNPTWLFQEGFEIAREPVFEHVKRATDVVFSALGLIVAAPLIAAAAAAIRLEDGGPAFFIQPRIGKHQAVFPLAKLRTMRALRDPGPTAGEADPYTRAGDERVTRAGRFLRATRLDELPQLWNVLRGDMSLIGPRAEWQRLVGDYERRIPCYHFRHLVKPGITGWAQVNYPYGANLDDTLRKLEYDLYYIRHFSFRLDAAIILKTVHLMLFGKGR